VKSLLSGTNLNTKDCHLKLDCAISRVGRTTQGRSETFIYQEGDVTTVRHHLERHGVSYTN